MENLKAKLIELEERLFEAETRASAGELDALIADARGHQGQVLPFAI